MGSLSSQRPDAQKAEHPCILQDHSGLRDCPVSYGKTLPSSSCVHDSPLSRASGELILGVPPKQPSKHLPDPACLEVSDLERDLLQARDLSL